MENIFEKYENISSYRCDLISGEVRAEQLLRDLKIARDAYNKALENNVLGQYQAREKECKDLKEEISKYQHWYFYVLWGFIYIVCAILNGALFAGLISAIFMKDASIWIIAIGLIALFLIIYIPFRRWSIRVADPKNTSDLGENVIEVDGSMAMLCIPVFAQFHAFLPPMLIMCVRGFSEGLYYKEQEMRKECLYYHTLCLKYEDMDSGDFPEADKCWEIIDQLDKLYCCGNCKHAIENVPFKGNYHCPYGGRGGAGFGCCNAKK